MSRIHLRLWSRKLVRNIMHVYQLATKEERREGLVWYCNAHNDAEKLANKYHITLEACIGVIAALSPGNEYGRNLNDAETLIQAFISHDTIPNVGVYGRKNINKALTILQGASPLNILGASGRAPKTTAFYTLILNPRDNETVCIDRHGKGAALNTREETAIKLVSEYEWLARHYRQIAYDLGLMPNQLQAIVWLVWRRLKHEDTTSTSA